MSVTDADRLAELEDERRFLLRSLRDLDAELEAGDVDVDDYTTLRDGYTKRAADVLREIDAGRAQLPARRQSSWGRRFAVAAVVVALAAVAVGSSRGRQASASPGRRSPAAPPTMSPSSSPRLGRSSARTSAAAQERYQRVLEERPDHPEAVTYSAWLLFIGSAGANEELRGAAVATARDQLTRATELDPTYPDPHCFLGRDRRQLRRGPGGGRNGVRPVPRARSTGAGPRAGRAVRERTGEHADDLNVGLRPSGGRRLRAGGAERHRRRARGPRSCPSASRARRRCECRAWSAPPRPPASTSPCVQSTAPSPDSSSSCRVSSNRAPSDEPFVGVDREADEVGEGLQRLDAAHVRARPEAGHAGVDEPGSHGVGLFATARRHGPLEVVAVPRLAAAGLGVADEVRAHRIGCVSGSVSRR